VGPIFFHNARAVFFGRHRFLLHVSEGDGGQTEEERDGEEEAAFEIGAVDVAGFGFGEGEDVVEAAVGPRGVPQDIAYGHEEGEEGVGVARFSVVAGGEVGEEGTAGALEHVVGDVQDPEADDEDGDGAWADFLGEGVAENVAEVGGVAYEKDGDGNGQGSGGDEGTAAAEAGSAAVAVVADDGLDQHAGDWAAEPDEGGPRVGNSQQLNVGGEEGELQGPAELHPCGDGCHSHDLPEGTGIRRRSLHVKGGRLGEILVVFGGRERVHVGRECVLVSFVLCGLRECCGVL